MNLAEQHLEQFGTHEGKLGVVRGAYECLVFEGGARQLELLAQRLRLTGAPSELGLRGDQQRRL